MLPGQKVDPIRYGSELTLELLGHLLQQGSVNFNTVHLHGGQDFDQGNLHLVEEVLQPLIDQLRKEDMAYQEGDVGILARIILGRVQVHLIEAYFLFTRSHHVLIADHPMIQVFPRYFLQVVIMLCGIQEIGRHHGISFYPPQFDAPPFEEHIFVFDILAVFLELLILEKRFQLAEDELLIQLLRSAIVSMSQGDIVRLMGIEGQGEAYELCQHRISGSGLEIKGKPLTPR